MIKMTTIKTNEKGVVALVTVVLIALLLTLITLGLTRSMIVNQRQTTDEQSANQAYYAAESGIQDGIRQIKAAQSTPGVPFPTKNTCDTGSAGNLNSDGTIRYSCLLISSEAKDSLHTISDQESLQLDVHPTTDYKSLVVQWHKLGAGPGLDGDVTDSALNSSTAGVNPSSSGYPGNLPATLRAMISVVPASLAVSRSDYRSNTSNIFMKPHQPAITPLGDISTGQILPDTGNFCTSLTSSNDGYACRMTVDFGSVANRRIILRLRSIYKADTKVKISLYNATTAIEPEIQAIIDSTGKVGDVVKRLQVRHSISQKFTDAFPDYAVETSEGICKNFNFSSTNSPTDSSAASDSCPSLP
jgi:hypothetical protein